MRGLILLLCSLLLGTMAHALEHHKPWITPGALGPKAVSALLEELATTPTGADLIHKARKKAKAQGVTLESLVNIGPLSATDTTLVRRFSRTRPREISYEKTSVIYLNKNLKALDALLDLAHELVHFTRRDAFNPYGKHFALANFISSMLEGKGGEVEAFLAECQVLAELLGSPRGMSSHCKDILGPDGTFDRDKGMEKFYRIGSYYKDFVANLRRQGVAPHLFPHLRPTDPLFISSAWGLPYPVAAYREFMGIRKRVCANEGRRLALIKAQEGTGSGGIWAKKYASFQGHCPKSLESRTSF